MGGGVILNHGTTTITGSSFTGNNSDFFGAAIYNDATATITGSTFIDNNSKFLGGAIYNEGTATITGTIFRSNRSTEGDGGAIYNNAVLNIIADKADTTFTGNHKDNNNALFNASTTNLNAGEKNIVFNDAIDGYGGTININAGSGETGIDAPVNGTVVLNNELKNNKVNMYSGTLNFGSNKQGSQVYTGTLGDFTVDFNYYGGNISLQNGEINSANLGKLTLFNDMNLALDVDLAAEKIDTITANSFISNDFNINISSLKILHPNTSDEHHGVELSVLGNIKDAARRQTLARKIVYTAGNVAYSPVYRYSASYDPDTAMLAIGPLGEFGGGVGGYEDFNPAILASPVAAQLGGYLVQLNSYDNAFRNMDMYMLMTKEQRQAMKLRNRYASTDRNLVYDPVISQYENKAGWFRPFATFENVHLDNGPRVSNVAYGSYFGADSELYDLGHGWDGMWSVYAGYNGSHQAYDGIGIYQNGGTVGAVGMAYKGNYFAGLTANIGASAGEANSMFGREDFTMLMSGVAAKTGYNWELADGKFIIQPSMLMSYSFVNTFDYHNAAGVGINSDPLHAIQLEPGLKFIGNLKNGWQPYLGVSVVWNIMDNTQFRANDVSLPSLSVDPYVRYGVGVRKAWGERFTGFLQAYFTNGGRNGVGLMAGFRFTVGKTPENSISAGNFTPEKLKTQVSLKSMK